MNMMKKRPFLAVVTVLLTLSAIGFQRPAIAAANSSGAGRDIALELIWQVANPAPNRTLAYGYLSFMSGLAPEAMAAGGELSERTARFSFFVDTVNVRVINNGPLRVIDRAGTMGIYLESAPNGDWSRPQTFHDGEQILAAELRYQVIINTLTGAFTASWDLPIVWSKRFAMGGSEYQLGRGGEHFEITFSGQLNPQAPPAAHIAGFRRGLDIRK